MTLHRTPIAVALAAAALLATPTPQAAAAPQDVATALPAATPANPASPDYDGDGKADLAVRLMSMHDAFPWYSWDIQVRYGSGSSAEVTHTDLGVGGYEIDHALLARDLDRDGFTDLVVPTRYASGVKIHIIPGSAAGLQVADKHSVTLPLREGDTSVTSLALVESPVRRLAVATSIYWEDSKGGHFEEGVQLLNLSSAGVPTGSPSKLKPGSGKIPKLVKGAGFGFAMDSWGSQLFIGAPDAKVNGKAEAGAVLAVTLDSAGVKSVKTITQATKSVTGAVGKYDHFGAGLAARDGYLVVGTPGDDVGSIKSTGSIQVFSLSKGAIKPLQRISQASPGVPGKAERGDGFGYGVAIGTRCGGVPVVLVGGPSEAIVHDEADGSAWLVPLRKAKGCSASQIYEGHGLPGKPYFHGIGGIVAFVRDRGMANDDLVIGGYGYSTEQPGRLFWVSAETGKVLVTLDGEFGHVAGR